MCDLTNRCYHFELTTAPNVIWTELGNLDFEPGASVMTLDPGNIGLAEVSAPSGRARLPTERSAGPHHPVRLLLGTDDHWVEACLRHRALLGVAQSRGPQ